MKGTMNFTQGKIFGPLIKFAMPVLLAMFLQAMYGAVDLLIVGQFGTPADVSAVATGSHVMHTVTSVIIGLAMGLTVLVGQRIGQQRLEEAGNAIGSGVCIFAVTAAVMTAVMMLTAVPMSRLMNAPEEAFAGTVTYVRICSAGSVFIVAYNVLGSVFRGLGDSKTPLLAVTISCVVNIVGDLVLVGVFNMAEAGAAIATVAAQAVSVVLCALLIRKRGLPFPFTRRSVRFHKETTGQILKLGAPIALQDFLVSASFLIITAIVNTLGVDHSAGVGIAEKLVAFIMLVPSSFSQSVSAFVAQNFGAGNYHRAKRAMWYGVVGSLIFGIFMFFFAFFRGDLLAQIFNRDPHVVALCWDYMKAYAIDCLLTAVMFCMTGYFNGCGCTTFVMTQGIIGAFGVRVPVSYFMSRILPVSLFRVGLATPASTFVQILLCIGYYFLFDRKLKHKTLPEGAH